MGPVDLIPTMRRERGRRRARARAWMGVGVSYAVLLAGTLAAAAASWPRDQEGPAATLAAIEAENEQHRQRLTQLSSEIAQKQRELAANRAVGNQPDWSILLAILAEALGPDAALREAALTMEALPAPQPAQTPAAPPRAGDRRPDEATDAEPPRSFTLMLTGLARSQSAVSGVVRRLEETGLFERIELVETRREGSDGSDLTAFRFRCRMGERRADR